MGTVILLSLQLSGSIYNPAVNIGLWLREKITLKEAIIYGLVQIIASFLTACVQNKKYSKFTHYIYDLVLAPGFDHNGAWDMTKLFFNELVFTFLLMFFIDIQTTPEVAFTNEAIFTGLLFILGFHAVRSESVKSGSVLNPAFGIGYNM